MTDPLPIPSGNDCDECSLCCVLAKTIATVEKVVGEDVVEYACTRLFWSCTCPGGSLVMQFKTAIGEWGDIASWSADGEPGDSYWYARRVGGLGTEVSPAGFYRLSCTIDEGLDSEITYYSNSIEVEDNVGIAPCTCDDGGVMKILLIEVDFNWWYYGPGTPSGTATAIHELDGTFISSGVPADATGAPILGTSVAKLPSGLEIRVILYGFSSTCSGTASQSEWVFVLPNGEPCRHIVTCDEGSMDLESYSGEHPDYYACAVGAPEFRWEILDVRLSIHECE